jgi:type II secretory pathway pseudopilin PulG
MMRNLAVGVRSDEDGFGLIEIVVSMLMLAVLSVAFLPVLVQGIKQSNINATIATATQMVQDQMELARNQNPDCSDVMLLGSTAVANVTDHRGVVLQTSRTTGGCPASYPGTILITVTVTRQDTGATVATAKTLVYVAAA